MNCPRFFKMRVPLNGTCALAWCRISGEKPKRNASDVSSAKDEPIVETHRDVDVNSRQSEPVDGIDGVIDFSDLNSGNLLGRGGFGSVYLCETTVGKVAVKVLHALTKNSRAMQESFESEKIALKLRHENIVTTVSVSFLFLNET